MVKHVLKVKDDVKNHRAYGRRSDAGVRVVVITLALREHV